MPKRKQTAQKPRGVYMPKKQKTSKKRRKSIKRKIKSKSRRTRNSKLPKILIIALSILIFSALIFITIRYINNMRNTDKQQELTYVVGLQDIPAYPESEFIFKQNTEDSSISNFISTGNSAYRLPARTNTSKVFTFYDEQLPTSGWEKVLKVEIGTDDKKDGHYWVKDGKGLRIYSKFNDIWYETISVEEANTGLAERVKEEIEREMILASSDAQDLLPDFPWVIKIPNEYVIRYYSGDFEDLRKASFKKIGGTEEVIITPIGYTGAKELDYFLEDYTYTLEEGSAGILNTIVIPKPGLRGMLNVNNENNLVAVLPNYYNNVVYVIHANEPESPFFEYVLENIVEQDSTTF